MKAVLYILFFYIDFQRIVSWMSRFGLIMLLLSIPTALVNTRLAHGALIFAYIFILAFPYMFTPMVLRELISNRHLSLVPGFHVRAGIALLIYTVVLAIIPCLSGVFGWDGVTPWRALVIFTLASAYNGFYGLILPSRYVLPLGAVVPLGLLILTFQYKPQISAVFNDPGFLITASVISIMGWIYALVVLSRKNYFRPIYTSTPLITGKPDGISPDAFAMDLGFFSRWQIGPLKSAAGTLLLGYADGIPNRIKRSLLLMVVSPILWCLFMLIVGSITHPPNPIGMPRIFLITSLMTSIGVGWEFGELAARGRLLWLRHGSDRLRQWWFMEKLFLMTLGLNLIIAALICITFLLSTRLPGIQLMYYMGMIIGGGFFCTYLSLVCKIYNWSFAATAITVIIALGFVVVVSLIILLAQEPSTVVLVSNPFVFGSILGGLLLFSIVLRAYARRGFTGIDWLVVKPIPVPRRRIQS